MQFMKLPEMYVVIINSAVGLNSGFLERFVRRFPVDSRYVLFISESRRSEVDRAMLQERIPNALIVNERKHLPSGAPLLAYGLGDFDHMGALESAIRGGREVFAFPLLDPVGISRLSRRNVEGIRLRRLLSAASSLFTRTHRERRLLAAKGFASELIGPAEAGEHEQEIDDFSELSSRFDSCGNRHSRYSGHRPSQCAYSLVSFAPVASVRLDLCANEPFRGDFEVILPDPRWERNTGCFRSTNPDFAVQHFSTGGLRPADVLECAHGQWLIFVPYRERLHPWMRRFVDCVCQSSPLDIVAAGAAGRQPDHFGTWESCAEGVFAVHQTVLDAVGGLSRRYERPTLFLFAELLRKAFVFGCVLRTVQLAPTRVSGEARGGPRFPDLDRIRYRNFDLDSIARGNKRLPLDYGRIEQTRHSSFDLGVFSSKPDHRVNIYENGAIVTPFASRYADRYSLIDQSPLSWPVDFVSAERVFADPRYAERVRMRSLFPESRRLWR
jgi:hypothetical protein